jgi:rhodanese-related sulfurtransferase
MGEAIANWLERLLARFLGPEAPSINPREAHRLHFEDEAPTLMVDVRQAAEVRAGAIPGVTHIPLTELGGRMAALPRDRQILTICYSGHRSPLAARRLGKAGYEVLNVAGGMQAWQEAGLPVNDDHPGS